MEENQPIKRLKSMNPLENQSSIDAQNRGSVTLMSEFRTHKITKVINTHRRPNDIKLIVALATISFTENAIKEDRL